MLTFRGRKKDMLALPDGQKVYAEDVEAVLREDPRVQGRGRRRAGRSGPASASTPCCSLDDPAVAPEVVAAANARLAPHQQIRGSTVWPDEDLPRTHTLKVRKPDILARLDERRPAGVRAHSRRGLEAGPPTRSTPRSTRSP